MSGSSVPVAVAVAVVVVVAVVVAVVRSGGLGLWFEGLAFTEAVPGSCP